MKLIIASTISLLAILLGGCNTLEGIGKDVQRGGQVLEDAAKKK